MCVGVVLYYTFHRQDKTIPHNREVWKLEKGMVLWQEKTIEEEI